MRRARHLLHRTAAKVNIHMFEESKMQPQAETLTVDSVDDMRQTCDGPSVDFICKVSQFLDTDPNDILAELGYYSTEDASQME
jgi:hypothetical protein